MGTLGMEGAFEGMVSGDVDVNWAKVHHPLWYDDEMARTRKASIDAQPRAGLAMRSVASPARPAREEELHDA
jgi:formate dehydrogenase subunit gamma